MKWYSELISDKYNSVGINQKKRGRKPVNEEIVAEILRLANNNPSWGYDRIAGVMKYLGYDVSVSTVRNVFSTPMVSCQIRNADCVEIGISLLKRSSLSLLQQIMPQWSW